MSDERPSAPKRPPRWGWRALGFLMLALVALITAQVQGYHSMGTFGCAVIGIVGGAFCSVKGVVSFARRDWDRFRPPPIPEDNPVWRLPGDSDTTKP